MVQAVANVDADSLSSLQEEEIKDVPWRRCKRSVDADIPSLLEGVGSGSLRIVTTERSKSERLAILLL